MKIIRNPYLNAAVTSVISLAYAAVFILTSGHLEFERILNHGHTLNSAFWNNWSMFLLHGNLGYIGYVYIAAAISVVMLSIIRKKNYDEYQAGILTTSFVAMGVILLLLFPAALLLVLSDPNYAVETLMFIIVAHWSVFLIANSIYAIKWCRG